MDIYFKSCITLYRSRTRPTTNGLDVAGAKSRCATNTDCRLADWQVNEENFVVECFNRVPIPKV